MQHGTRAQSSRARPFTGLTTYHEAAVEGQKRWPVLVFQQNSRVERGLVPLPQPYLLGDNTSMFFTTSQADHLTQAQKVNVVENLKAIVANHMLDPQTVPPQLRQYIGKIALLEWQHKKGLKLIY